MTVVLQGQNKNKQKFNMGEHHIVIRECLKMQNIVFKFVRANIFLQETNEFH